MAGTLFSLSLRAAALVGLPSSSSDAEPPRSPWPSGPVQRKAGARIGRRPFLRSPARVGLERLRPRGNRKARAVCKPSWWEVKRPGSTGKGGEQTAGMADVGSAALRFYGDVGGRSARPVKTALIRTQNPATFVYSLIHLPAPPSAACFLRGTAGNP